MIPDASTLSLAIDSQGSLAPIEKIAARVALASTADAPTTISTADGSMSVAFELHGAKKQSVAITNGYALYANADVHGGHYVQAVVNDGLEGFVSFDRSPGTDAVFDVAMTPQWHYPVTPC